MIKDTKYFLCQRAEMMGVLEILFHVHDSKVKIKLVTLLHTLMQLVSATSLYA